MSLPAFLSRHIRLSQLLFGPPPCVLCATACEGEMSLCTHCRRQMPWQESSCVRCAFPLNAALDNSHLLCGRCLQKPPPLAATFAPLVYRDRAQKLLLGFKLSGDLAAGRLLGELLGLHLLSRLPAQLLSCCEASRPPLVPVPLHPRRLRQRGFNQSLELCRPLARMLQLPIASGLMRRTQDTQPFRLLTAEQRHKSAQKLFVVRATASEAPPECAILVDDVMTTGTTLFSAARALQEAGCRRVYAAVVARTP